MPLHEYACTECGHEFEELIRRSGQKVACPKCGAAKVTRKFSVIGGVVAKSAAPACESGRCPSAATCPGACHLD